MNSNVTSIRGAFKVLDALLSADEKETYRQQSESEFATTQHFSLGVWIRNTWIYEADDTTIQALFGNEILDPDQASGILLKKYHNHLKRKK